MIPDRFFSASFHRSLLPSATVEAAFEAPLLTSSAALFTVFLTDFFTFLNAFDNFDIDPPWLISQSISLLHNQFYGVRIEPRQRGYKRKQSGQEVGNHVGSLMDLVQPVEVAAVAFDREGFDRK